ncbi:phytanoyl-CoA dioxygenase family protein [bacterium]|nr:phytanoyl-CoA dioxygenase family protein [bacterium]
MAGNVNTRFADFYQEHGYYIRREPLLPPAVFKRLCDIFEELLEKNKDIRSDELDTPHFAVAGLHEMLMHDGVLDLVEQLIGPDIGLWSSHFISKEPYKGRATPWHEDSAYWAGRFDRMDKIVTVWLSLDVSDQSNGCMKVIPGSHLTGDSKYEAVDQTDFTFDRQITDMAIGKPLYLELQKNQCSFHDARIVHGADANTSSRRRSGYTMRYFSQSMRFNKDHPDNKQHKLWHCRGRNIHENPVEN